MPLRLLVLILLISFSADGQTAQEFYIQAIEKINNKDLDGAMASFDSVINKDPVFYDAYYNRANAIRRVITAGFERAFEKVDIIMTPTAPSPAFKIGEKISDPVAMYLEDIFTVPANMTGLPAISVPVGSVEMSSVHENPVSLPVGIQLTARHGDEKTLFEAGKDILGESSKKWDNRTMDLEAEVIFAILILIIIAVFGGALYYLSPIINFFSAHSSSSVDVVRSIFDFLIVISFPVSLILLIGIIVAIERLKLIRKKEQAIYGPPEGSAGTSTVSGMVAPGSQKTSASPETTDRWRKIVALSDSDNQNDWKQAIIDADSILDEMLTKMNYPGDDLGSKLRSATRADFKTLEQAGEAHGVRNRIAHDGSNFVMSKHEAKRVVNLYRQVFEEFFFI